MAESEKSEKNWRQFARLKENRNILRRSARKIENATLKHAHRFIIRRLDNVRDVRRHALGWLGLMVLLIGLSAFHMTMYQSAFSKIAPAPGGTYAEGVVGSLDTINPLFATSSAERAASKLVFGSLLSYDRQNQLRGELAETWVSSKDGKTVTVTLRDNLRWHDGAPLTADDILFTVGLIKNSRTHANEALSNTWADVGVTKQSDRVIVFKLPVAYAPFPHALTFGVLPKHILEDTQPERLRESAFNREPVGSGPFVFRNLQIISTDASRLVVYMNAYNDYVLGRPKLDRFQLHTYKDQEQLKRGFLTDEINAAVDLTADEMKSISDLKPDAVVSSALVNNGVFALFRNDHPLLKDVALRSALEQATDRQALLESIHGYGAPMEGPLTRNLVRTNAKQASFNKDAAAKKLDSIGWKLQNGVRTKGGEPLKLSLVAPNSGDFPVIAKLIADQWRAVGIDVQVEEVSPASIQQNVLLPRAYDVLVYELAIGADPDVFAYWHSSQARADGINLANYSSGVSDDALSGALGGANSALREAKYDAFTRQWIKDVPAIALYQPRLHYIADETAKTITSRTVLADSMSRYRAVEYWTVNRERLNNTP